MKIALVEKSDAPKAAKGNDGEGLACGGHEKGLGR